MSRVGPDFWLPAAILLGALVVLPRSFSISLAHNENIDDEYHMRRGVLFWEGKLEGVELNDPPLGEALGAVPLLATRAVWGPFERSALYGKSLRPERILTLVAIWKSLLFLPLVGVVFAWCRRLYGLPSAALAVCLFLAEPTFAAHIPSAALDVLGAEGIVISCFLMWRYLEAPSLGRLLGAASMLAVAVAIKHTAVILPGALGAMALLWRLSGRTKAQLRMALPLFVTSAALVLWALTLFDFSSIRTEASYTEEHAGASLLLGDVREHHPEIARFLARPWPGGVYLRSFLTGLEHDSEGHAGFLLGERRQTGWWFYFPVVAVYKVPVGFALVLVLGVASFFVVRPRFEEWSLALPLFAWLAFLAFSRIDIGFRHFLAPLSFLLMLASRSVSVGGRFFKGLAWAGCAAGALHALSFHPDYLSYVNFPRERAYLDISDSNIDWGESLKQARRWIDAHKEEQRTIYLRYFWRNSKGVEYYLGHRVTNLLDSDPRPTTGLLILSPVWLAGDYDPLDRYRDLRQETPRDVIGHCLLVYDLDAINAARREGAAPHSSQ